MSATKWASNNGVLAVAHAIKSKNCSMESPSKVTAVFDPADGDYDADVVVPTPMPTHPMLWLDVNTSGVIVTGSLALE